jgi:hypothetical protein
MFDYEWASVQHNVNCRLARAVVVPDAIPPARLERYGARGKLRTYPGLKEEYYLADFEPSPAVLGELGLDPREPIVVVRTPPAVSLYHRFENELFAAVLARVRGSQAVVLPRIESQRRELLDAGGFIVPAHAIDAQSLIAYADLVISAGGTMNREAVALGTPVWTTFEGRLGAVDERLIAQGRMRAWSAPSRSSFASAPAATTPSACATRPGRARRAARERGIAAGSEDRLGSRLDAPPPPEVRGGIETRLRGPTIGCNAPTASLGGLSAASPFAAATRGRRRAGRARVLPRVLAALRGRRTCRCSTSGCWTGRWPWVVLGTVAILALSRVYQRRWRYVSQRDIEHLVRSLVIATVLLVSVVALAHPVLWIQKTRWSIHHVRDVRRPAGQRRSSSSSCSRWSSSPPRACSRVPSTIAACRAFARLREGAATS